MSVLSVGYVVEIKGIETLRIYISSQDTIYSLMADRDLAEVKAQ